MQLRLDPLGKETAQELLTALIGEHESTLPAKRLIIERTEGNPFFMEEMLQTLLEQGVLVRNATMKVVKPLDEIRVPATVQAILASRIDRLPAAERELLQTLAALGRKFSRGLIGRVLGKCGAPAVSPKIRRVCGSAARTALRWQTAASSAALTTPLRSISVDDAAPT